MKLDAETIELIYAGGLDDRPWQKVVDLFCEKLNALIFVLAFRTYSEGLPSVGVQAFRGNGRAIWDGYLAEYNDINTFDYDRLEPGRVHALSEFEGEATSDIERMRRNLHDPMNAGEAYCMSLSSGGNATAYLIWVKTAGQPITPEEEAWCRMAHAPLARAVDGYNRMRVAELSSRLAADALGHLDVGVVAIDRHDRILFSNAVAERLVAECPDLGRHAGRLVAVRPELAAKLEGSRTKAQAAQVRGRDEAMVGLLMSPVEGGRDELGPGSRPERAIYMHEVARTLPIAEQLISELFNLPKAEARLSVLLCQGLTLREAGERMGVKENTARTYSKLIYSKLGVSRQVDLVRVMLTSVAIFGTINRP